jgi:hypothetical protein
MKKIITGILGFIMLFMAVIIIASFRISALCRDDERMREDEMDSFFYGV